MYIVNELKQIFPKFEVSTIRDNFLENLFEITEKYFQDKSMFTLDNFSFCYLDEFALETNCHDDIFSTIYININQPLNYKQSASKKISTKVKKNNNTKYKIPELYLSLSEIRKGLYDTFLSHFDSNNIVWMDKFAICMKSTILLENGESHSYYFRVIPAFTYHNKNGKQGLVYYSNNDIMIEYPEQFISNYLKKNKQTKDKFRQCVLIFKNILLKEKAIDRIPSEIIETLLYNVPNEMLKNDDIQSMINLVNFLRNNPLKSFKTIDEQDFAFSSIYRGMSIFYCKHILKIIEKYLTHNL